MNRERFAKYQFNAKCTTNTLGQIRSRYKDPATRNDFANDIVDDANFDDGI